TSETTFHLRIDDDRWNEHVKDKEYRFGEPLSLGSAVLRIINTNGRTADHNKYYFVLNLRSELVSRYRSALEINWAMRGSSMLDLRIVSEVPERDLDFLKAYYDVVEEMGLEEKNRTL